MRPGACLRTSRLQTSRLMGCHVSAPQGPTLGYVVAVVCCVCRLRECWWHPQCCQRAQSHCTHIHCQQVGFVTVQHSGRHVCMWHVWRMRGCGYRAQSHSTHIHCQQVGSQSTVAVACAAWACMLQGLRVTSRSTRCQQEGCSKAARRLTCTSKWHVNDAPFYNELQL
jgi:hypothetical protein